MCVRLSFGSVIKIFLNFSVNLMSFSGEMSPFLVESGAVVRVLDVKDDCYQLCKCGETGHLIDCHKICDKTYRNDCSLDGYNISHSTELTLNDRQCVCFNSRIQCSIRDCIEDCPQDYSPVCAANGQTFPNRCYVKCNGFSTEQHIDGSCHTISDCIKCSETQRFCLNEIFLIEIKNIFYLPLVVLRKDRSV